MDTDLTLCPRCGKHPNISGPCEEPTKEEIAGNNMLRLLRRDWIMENGLWSNPKHIDNKRRLMFTFEQACRAEGL